MAITVEFIHLQHYGILVNVNIILDLLGTLVINIRSRLHRGWLRKVPGGRAPTRKLGAVVRAVIGVLHGRPRVIGVIVTVVVVWRKRRRGWGRRPGGAGMMVHRVRVLLRRQWASRIRGVRGEGITRPWERRIGGTGGR